MSEVGLNVARGAKKSNSTRRKIDKKSPSKNGGQEVCNQKTGRCATDRILKTHLSLDRVLIVR